MDPEQFLPSDPSQFNTTNSLSSTAPLNPGSQFPVYPSDLECVRSKEMLPDNILDNFMEHLVTKSGNDDITHLSVHFLYKNPATQRVSVRHEMLDHIGSASQILIPVHMEQPLHYFLILVNTNQLKITIMDSLPDPEQRKSVVNDIVEEVLTAFDKHRQIEDPWEIYYDESCPKQDNSVDCGIYVLHYAESILRNQTNVPFCRDMAKKYRNRILEYDRNPVAQTRLNLENRGIDRAMDTDGSLSTIGELNIKQSSEYLPSQFQTNRL
jgi:Ulp1 family protease